jgi:acetyl-CoA synthetase
MNSADSEYLVTCEGYYRRSDALDHKNKADEGLEDVDQVVISVVVDRLGEDETETAV